jgi:hypothetical protein
MKLHDNSYIKRWNRILKASWPEVRKTLLDTSEKGKALRQCSPFGGVLTPRERWRIYRRFRDCGDT